MLVIEEEISEEIPLEVVEERVNNGLCPGCGKIWRLIIGQIVAIEPTPKRASESLAKDLAEARIFLNKYICWRCARKFISKQVEHLVHFKQWNIYYPEPDA